MGLDWNPANKPKPGFEKEYSRLLKDLLNENARDLKKKQKRYFEISISAHESLNAPRVGIDKRATAWAKKQWRKIDSPKPAMNKWIKEMHGYYVLELVPECDGLPQYSNGYLADYVEIFSFRGQFLHDCKKIIGNALLESAYVHKSPTELAEYGRKLKAKAESFMKKHKLRAPTRMPKDSESIPGQLHVVLSAARWCLFWAERGHSLEPYY